ncbi:Protein of uncharacterised function (DUF330) [Streptococcus pneumoniae]|jgi:uncharacterized lipoprotein YmbA|uniref:Lipoprotein, putative n=4 Tax=Gammaproteobacteria TaxID=1236 RepID=A4VR28_STUS1|nr:lipoprotein, putative [Stutzerimonas stutzeri A1501]AEJ07043.1 putative lipoprotein [Stutzerimonas stutzeri]AKN28826.1 putative lipoprotein [Stutzerimonas stutzeri]CJK92705.1 Protein of uncharacterised function (DUF330) [Streptococcus pneumoniae]
MTVMKNLLRVPTVLLLASIGLTGCVGLQPAPMYRLDSGTTEVPERIDGAAVLLAPVTLADYLQRDALLQRLADGSLAADDQQARWAGSLKADIEQLMLRQLAWRLDTQSLVLGPADEGFAPEVQIELSITRLDSGPAYPAVLEAQWRLRDKAGKHLGSRLVRLQEEHLGTTADQVRAQSALLQRLSEMVAGAVEPALVAKTPPKPAPAKPQVSKSAEPPAPRIPAAEPIRTDLEVFRF